MSSHRKNIVVTVLFFTLLIGALLVGIILPDTAVSRTERRTLAQMPGFSVSSIFSGKFFSEFDDYTLDQFPLRDDFRSLAAFWRFNLFMQKDNNKIYLSDGHVCKLEYPLNEASVVNASDKFNSVYQSYLAGMNVYYTIIPDKNYFTAEANGYPSLDYERLEELLCSGVENMTYIPLYDTLSLADYYRTDTHWSQPSIGAVVDRLAEYMGFGKFNASSWTEHTLEPFYGVYYGQSALNVSPDKLTYLTNADTDGATVFNYETGKSEEVYRVDKFSDTDPYDVFLTGASPLLKITNPNASTDRELIIFRDSFGSSLAPLLIGEYSTITLVDLRYISSELLGKFIDFENQDVLFMLSTLVYNSSYMFK